jgi:hypothetical protein
MITDDRRELLARMDHCRALLRDMKHTPHTTAVGNLLVRYLNDSLDEMTQASTDERAPANGQDAPRSARG